MKGTALKPFYLKFNQKPNKNESHLFIQILIKIMEIKMCEKSNFKQFLSKERLLQRGHKASKCHNFTDLINLIFEEKYITGKISHPFASFKNFKYLPSVASFISLRNYLGK